MSRNSCIQILSVSETLLSDISELAPARLCAPCRILWSEDSVFLACDDQGITFSITTNRKFGIFEASLWIYDILGVEKEKGTNHIDEVWGQFIVAISNLGSSTRQQFTLHLCIHVRFCTLSIKKGLENQRTLAENFQIWKNTNWWLNRRGNPSKQNSTKCTMNQSLTNSSKDASYLP